MPLGSFAVICSFGRRMDEIVEVLSTYDNRDTINVNWEAQQWTRHYTTAEW